MNNNFLQSMTIKIKMLILISTLIYSSSCIASALVWQCTSSDIPSQYLPSICHLGTSAGSSAQALTDLGGAASCIGPWSSQLNDCYERVKMDMLPSGTSLIGGGGATWGGIDANGVTEYGVFVYVQSTATGSTAQVFNWGPANTAVFAGLYPNGEQPVGNSVICNRYGATDDDYSACPSGSYVTHNDANGNPDKLTLVP